MGWGKPGFEGVGDKCGVGGEASWLCLVLLSRKELFREGVTLEKTMRCWWLQFQGKENNGKWYDGERRVGNTTIRFSWLPKLANYFKTVLRESHHSGKNKQVMPLRREVAGEGS